MANRKAIMAFFIVAILAATSVFVVVDQNNNQVQNADVASDIEVLDLGVFETYDDFWYAANHRMDEYDKAKAKVTNDSDPERNGDWTVVKFWEKYIFFYKTQANDSIPDELIIVDETGNAKDLKVVDDMAITEFCLTDSGRSIDNADTTLAKCDC